MSETKICEQCQVEKDIEQFYKRPQKNNPNCRIKICAQCSVENLRESRRKSEARMEELRKQEEAEREAERIAREQEEQRRKERALELSIQANKRCPRCKQVRTDGELWPNGHLYFTKYCQQCTDKTPHFIYKLTCPLDGLVRYVGITCRTLKERLGQHMNDGKGSEHKQEWIETLKARGLSPLIEMIDEAPNEREALRKEVEWCEQYIRQGQPLTNMYPPFSAQDILDLQSGRIKQEEQRHQEEERSHLSESSSGFRLECSRTRQAHITRWKNRHEHVYVADTSYSPLNPFGSWFCNGVAARYEHVTYEHALPKDRAERQAILAPITLAFLSWDEVYARSFTDAMREDIHTLFRRQVPIICTKRDSEGVSKEGYVIEVVQQDKHYTPLIHSFSHRIDPSRALVCLPPAHCGHLHCVGQCIVQKRARFDERLCDLPVPAALPSHMSQEALF